MFLRVLPSHGASFPLGGSAPLVVEKSMPGGRGGGDAGLTLAYVVIGRHLAVTGSRKLGGVTGRSDRPPTVRSDCGFSPLPALPRPTPPLGGPPSLGPSVPTPDSLVAQTTPGDPGWARLFFSLIRCFPFFLNPSGPFCLGFTDDSSALGLVVSGDIPDSPQM